MAFSQKHMILQVDLPDFQFIWLSKSSFLQTAKSTPRGLFDLFGVNPWRFSGPFQSGLFEPCSPHFRFVGHRIQRDCNQPHKAPALIPLPLSEARRRPRHARNAAPRPNVSAQFSTMGPFGGRFSADFRGFTEIPTRFRTDRSGGLHRTELHHARPAHLSEIHHK